MDPDDLKSIGSFVALVSFTYKQIKRLLNIGLKKIDSFTPIKKLHQQQTEHWIGETKKELAVAAN